LGHGDVRRIRDPAAHRGPTTDGHANPDADRDSHAHRNTLTDADT
jgi:hypothetical protein